MALQTPSEPQREVIEALRSAYGLEASLVSQARPGRTFSREEVYAHYRTGFGEQLAQELTSYSWQAESKDLRGTEPALAVPDTVGVLQLRQDRSLVAWIPPTAFRRQWNAPRCLIDRMVREDGHWVIDAHEP